MRNTDWNFDFSALPYWDIRLSPPYIYWTYDEFLELPQSGALCCIYSIAEVSMWNYMGFLAIIKNKEDPSLFLNITDYGFCDNISASKDGSLIFLQPSLYFKETNISKRPILIIDIEKNLFSYIDTNNYSPSYKIEEINEKVFKINADAYQKKHSKGLWELSRMKIYTDRLKWYELKELGSLPEMMSRR